MALHETMKRTTDAWADLVKEMWLAKFIWTGAYTPSTAEMEAHLDEYGWDLGDPVVIH